MQASRRSGGAGGEDRRGGAGEEAEGHAAQASPLGWGLKVFP
jgi:hypothetical protein